MSKIKLEGVTKEFSETLAVDDVDIDIEEGDFFSLLGPSGCGKTTTLRMIAGFEKPTEGEIYINGELVNDIQPENRPTNIVFQDLALFTHMNVNENIAYGLKLSNLGAEEIEQEVHKALELVSLPGFEDRNVEELSGGQQQRVALARAIANAGPDDILLFDEPLASLDRELRQSMQMELRKIQNETGLTFIYVTHDQEVALTMSDKMAVMRDGAIQQVGTPMDMYNRPTNNFVGNFIGDMVNFDGRMANGQFIYDESEETSLKIGEAEMIDDGNPNRLSVRPEKCTIAANAADLETDNVIEVTVEDVVFRGPTTAYTLSHREKTLDIELQNSFDNSIFEIGDRLFLGIDSGSCLMYAI